jgi:hypothetical protein
MSGAPPPSMLRAAWDVNLFADPSRTPGVRPSEVRVVEAYSGTTVLVRELKVSYEDAPAFLLAAIAVSNAWLSVDETGTFIDEAKAVEEIRGALSSARTGIDFKLRGRFAAALRFQPDALRRSILLETEREYVLFHWNTDQ